jgi:hypothetical protein
MTNNIPQPTNDAKTGERNTPSASADKKPWLLPPLPPTEWQQPCQHGRTPNSRCESIGLEFCPACFAQTPKSKARLAERAEFNRFLTALRRAIASGHRVAIRGQNVRRIKEALHVSALCGYGVYVEFATKRHSNVCAGIENVAVDGLPFFDWLAIEDEIPVSMSDQIEQLELLAIETGEREIDAIAA